MDWYGILEAIRRLVRRPKDPFTASQLAREADLKTTKKSSGQQIASAWLSKFVGWGYVLRMGNAPPTFGRPERLYVLTEWGRKKNRPLRKFKRRP